MTSLIICRSLPHTLQADALLPPLLSPLSPQLPVHQRNMEGRVDRAIIDRWRQRRLVRGDGRPGRGRGLEEEDNDEYQPRMEFPPDDVVAAVTY